MNLHPPKTHECVTIVLVALDQYSPFLSALDSILKETRLPYELIIVEGNAPESVRLKIERKKRGRKNIKIIYSTHHPRMAEAFNLALPHIRTRLAFFMNNNVRVTPLWLEHLLDHAKNHPGVACPSVAYRETSAHPEGLPEVDMNGFLATREVLRCLGEFDLKVSTPLLGLDLAQHFKAHGIGVHAATLSVIEYEPARFPNSSDLKLFQHQWNEKHLRDSVHHMRGKWGLHLEESRYVLWVQKRNHYLQKRPTDASFGWQELPLQAAFPKVSLKKFLQILTRA
jgi:hypothetical protein